MDRWSVLIDRVDNGYICTWQEEIEEGGGRRIVPMKKVFQDGDETDYNPGLQSIYEMLWFIVEQFGMIGSKHDSKRIMIYISKKDEVQ
jgi:hypothetical protein